MNKYILILLAVIIGVGALLRFHNLSIVPPGLYTDEVSIGLNAKDILLHGKDQYGVFHPLFFRAFGEYKMPVYIYLVSGAMSIFGSNEFAVRFPSALFGTLTILAVFLLTRELFLTFDKKIRSANISGLLASLLLATSSWHLQFSRGGFEASVALFFYVVAIVGFLYFLDTKQGFFLLSSSIFLLITSYTYDGYRLLVPLTGLLGFAYLFRTTKNKRSLWVSFLLLIICSLPLFFFTVSNGGLMRFSQTTAFSHAFPQWDKQLVADLVIFLKNYLSYFSFTYLFRFGDQINRHQVIGFGLLYLWQLPYIIVGFYAVLTRKHAVAKWLLMFLLFAGAITPALTIPSPHSLRFLVGVIPFIVLTVFGIVYVIKKKTIAVKIFIALTICLALTEFGYYLHYYYTIYPGESLIDWGGSCKAVVQEALKEQQVGHIIVDPTLCVPEYFLFYSPNLPVVFSTSIQKPPQWERDSVLLIKNKDKRMPNGQLVKNIYLPNLNHDVFAQFWKL